MGESYTPVYTDGDGRYRIDGLPAGSREVRASTSTGQRTTGKVTIGPGENVFDLAFEEESVTVSGQVLAMDGEPVRGARLQLVKLEEHVFSGPGGAGSSSSWNPRSLTTSRADGTFVFETVTDGRYLIQAVQPGLTNAESEEVEVRGVAVSGLLVRLAPGAVLSGQIHGLRPEDLSELHLIAVRESGHGLIQGEVSPEGSYRIADLAPGVWHVSAQLMPQHRRVSGRVALAAGQTEAVLDLEFSTGLALAGQLVDHGEPRGGLRLRLKRLDSSSSVPLSGRTLYYAGDANVMVDAGGRFRFEGLEPGRYELLVEISGIAQSLEEVDLDADLDLVLELPIGRLSGRVRDPNGQGLAGARLQVERLDGEDGAAPGRGVSLGPGSQRRTDTEGVFVLDGIEAGRYRITAHEEGYAPAWSEVSLLSGNELRETELVLQPTPGLELEIADAAENPSRQVAVAFLDRSGRGVLGGFYDLDASGRTKVPNAPLGSWELLVQGSGAAVRVRVEVVPGVMTEVEWE